MKVGKGTAICILTSVLMLASAPSILAQWIPDGAAVCTASFDQARPTIVSDGAGGAIITWYDGRSHLKYPYDIYAQRVDASGNPLWGTNGVAICEASRNELYPAIASDGLGGAIIAWQDG